MSVKAIEKTPPLDGVIPPPFDNPRPSIQNFPNSSIANAEPATTSFFSSKPLLDPPTDPFLNTLNHLNSRTEPTCDKWFHIQEREIEKQFKEIDADYLDQMSQMEKTLQAAHQASSWEALQKITSLVSAPLALYCGSSAALAGNPILGGILVTSGVFSIANLALNHTRIWEWAVNQIAGDNRELKERLKTYLPTAVGLATTTLTLTGCWVTWHSMTQTGLQITNRLVMMVADITDGLVKCQSGMTSADHKGKRANLNALQSKIDLANMDLKNLIKDTQEFHKDQTDMCATLGKILEERNRAIQVVQQPV